MKNLYNLMILSTIIGGCFSSVYAQNSCFNVALNKPAISSSSYTTQTPERAFDGDLTTNWSASDHTGWIQVDLQNKVTVDSMKLYVNQYYPGNTIHEIKVSEDMVHWTLVDTLTRYTTNNQLITVKFNPALPNVRGVMINTPGSNSWIAWYEIEVYAIPYKPTVSQNGMVLTSSSQTNNQWYFNGSPIPNAKSPTYTATVSGSYQVGLSNGNGCVSMSDEVNVKTITTGTNKTPKNEILIYPNPAKDNVIIDGLTNAKIEVFNFQGQSIKLITIPGSKTTVDISDLNSGIYSLKMTTTDGITVKKLFKQ